MALLTYTELQAAIADWLNRTDLSSQIPDFIRLAEEDVESDAAEDKYGTLTLADSPVSLPSDCREVRSLFFSDPGAGGDIEIVPPETLAYRQVHMQTVGRPRYAAVVKNGTELLLAPTPDAAYVAGIEYAAKLQRLSATNPTNWLLVDHPKVYLYGALAQAAPFLKDDGRMPVWMAERDRAVESLRLLTARRRMANTPVVRPRHIFG
jgi:hypothetical protein